MLFIKARNQSRHLAQRDHWKELSGTSTQSRNSHRNIKKHPEGCGTELVPLLWEFIIERRSLWQNMLIRLFLHQRKEGATPLTFRIWKAATPAALLYRTESKWLRTFLRLSSTTKKKIKKKFLYLLLLLPFRFLETNLLTGLPAIQ